jgi:TRAP-type mannitol/chloroaromatic compound transport system substrate-binding protein
VSDVIHNDATPAVAGRRRFLKGAAVSAAGAGAVIGAPAIVRAQSTTLKMQGSWGATDIFNEFAEDYVGMVNEMSGGELKIDYLVGGAVVKPFSVQDATHAGVLDGAHTVPAYWYGKNKAASLFGSAPVWGWDAEQALGWIHYGGGQELYNELVQEILGLNVVGFFCMPMPTQPLGWFKQEITSVDQMKGLKYRTVGLATDVMQAMGLAVTQLPGGEIVPALERGVIEAFEYNNPTSDRRFGAQDVSKVYMLGSYHQAMEFFEIIWNKDKYESLPPEHQAILKYAAQAASSNNIWKAFDQYSKDFVELQESDGVTVYRTPQDVMQAQLEAWDQVIEPLVQDEFFGRVIESQKDWSQRVSRYVLTNSADYKLAYEHYFGSLGF